MNKPGKYLCFYIGCNTNKGILAGIKKDLLFIETGQQSIVEYDIKELGITLFLYLNQLNDLTTEHRKQLIKEGVVIGRPHGYTFTTPAFLYLLSLGIDMFGLINAGYAMDVKGLT